MKVLHIYRTFFPDTQGGLEETIRQICIGTRSQGVESRVLTLSRNPAPAQVEIDGIKVYRAKQLGEIASCSFSATVFNLYDELLDWADIVNFHFPWPFADVLYLATRKRRPTVLTYHSDIVRQKVLLTFYKPLMMKFLSAVDSIVCTSPNYLATSDTLTHFNSKTDVIPIGIEESFYPTVQQTDLESAREKWGSDYFLFVGVFRYYKGLHLLLEAAKGAPYKIVIVGSGPIEPELRAQAQDLGLDNVIFTGRVSDEEKVALFHNCRAIVFPSYLRTEAFGVTLLEGAMYGKPLISTEIGSGTSHICVHDLNGLVVPPGHARYLRRAMDQLYEFPDRARIMGRRSRKRYEQLFTGDLMGVRYAKLYHSILGGTDSPAISSVKKTKWQE